MLAYDCYGSALYRLCDKVVSIDRRTCNGEETTPRACGARVVGEVGNLDLLIALSLGVCDAPQ